MNVIKRIASRIKYHLPKFIYCYLIFIYLETAFRAFTVGELDNRFFYVIIFSIPLATILFTVTSIAKPIVNKILFNLLIGIVTIFFCIHTVYYRIFQDFMSVYSIATGADVLGNFAKQTLIGIKNSIIPLIIILVPFVLSLILTVRNRIKFDHTKYYFSLIKLVGALIVHVICIFSLLLISPGPMGAYESYTSIYSGTSVCIHNFGVLQTAGLEIKAILFDERSSVEIEYIEDKYYSSDEYNVYPISFNEILNSTSDDMAKELCVYLNEREPTNKNEYSGYFEGYNLITVCAESFSPYLIDEELTPTLYKMSKGGFVFNNYYASFDSVTTNGEYTFNIGNFPDMTLSKAENSFVAAADNYLPFTLANQFRNDGAETFAYHNFDGGFYSRDITHPNLGYETFKTPTSGLDMFSEWKNASDLDMIKASIDDYINTGKRFHTYYMTFSGHYEYDWTNQMCVKNRDKVEHLSYTDHVKAYISCNLELEYAMQYLLAELENAGIADKTVIVLSTDHFPYGLTIEEYSELAGFAIEEPFGKYKSSLIMYNPAMEPVEIDSVCCSLDVAPTLLNLFGFDYDSRLIMGRDIFSDSYKIAILQSQSYITENYMYDSIANKVIPIKTMPNLAELNEDMRYVRDAFIYSRHILKSDYYSYIKKYIK